MIEAHQLTVAFEGRRALGPVTGAFGGAPLLVAGPAQSGKSTLLKALCGLVPPSAGHVSVDGVDLGRAAPAELDAARSQFGMVFQSDALFDSLDALDNVALPLLRRGIARDEARAQARAALGQVGLDAAAHLLPEGLSGGMRKRLGLARAIVARPRYLLADDPLAGLDPATTARVVALLFELWANRGGLIVATADPTDLWGHFADALVLDRGEVVARGAPAEVRADPRAAALFGEAP